jgi:hypothetical protein
MFEILDVILELLQALNLNSNLPLGLSFVGLNLVIVRVVVGVHEVVLDRACMVGQTFNVMRSYEPLLFLIGHGFLDLLHVVLWRKVQLVAGGNFAEATTRCHTLGFQFSNLACEHNFHFDMFNVLRLVLNCLVDVV